MANRLARHKGFQLLTLALRYAGHVTNPMTRSIFIRGLVTTSFAIRLKQTRLVDEERHLPKTQRRKGESLPLSPSCFAISAYPFVRGYPATPFKSERGCRRALSRRAFCPAPKGAVLHTQGPARTLNRRAFLITRRPGKPTGPGFPPARAWDRLPPPSGCCLLFRQSRWSLARH